MQAQEFFSPVTLRSKTVDPARTSVEAKHLYEINVNGIRQKVSHAPNRFSNDRGIIVEFPNIKGDTEKFTVYESSNFEPELQAMYPEIRSYAGRGIDDPTAYLRFSIDQNGIQSMIRRADAKTEFIEPYTTDKTVYVLFDSHYEVTSEAPFLCNTPHQEVVENQATGRSSAQLYKQFRLALSCNGEYATYHGGTVAGALAAMNATMTRVNGVYEEDLSVHLNIIANNTAVIYTNASSDPYSSMTNWNSELQATLTSVIGEANYDIGHMFGATGGGGNAGCIGCVCVDGQKGSGITSPADGNPTGDTFDIDYVAHEMGHQLGANHTFSHESESSGVQVEPGGGSTLMAYAGITPYNVQMNSDDYFAYRSISQIQSNLTSKTCAVNTAISNQLPTINVGTTSVTIPKGTAFFLTGTATDPENNALTYCWEQNNSVSASTGANSICYGTKPDGPNFRSIAPVTTGTRFFPKYSDVLNGNLYNTWESVLDIGRTLTFTLTVRDLNGVNSQTKTSNKAVIVSSTSGPFKVTYPSVNSAVPANTPFTLTWDVAGTTASPFNVANVKISYSTDNGANFVTAYESTPNDGSESITIPVTSLECLIKIESIGHIFYCVSGKFLSGYQLTPGCMTSYTSPAVAIPDGTGANVYGAYASIPLTISQGTTIEVVKVNVNVTHPYISDLVIELVAPYGTKILWNRQCTSNDNINATFVSTGGSAVVCASPTIGNINPNQSLTAFHGQSSAGTWTLRAKDGYNTDAGTINSWGISFCNNPYAVIGVEDHEFVNFNIYPNPSNGIFNLSLQSHNTNDTVVQLYDLSGRLISTNSFNLQSSDLTAVLNYSKIAKGIYLMKITKGNESTSKQIVID